MDAYQMAQSAPLQQMPYTLNLDRNPSRALTFNRKIPSRPNQVTLDGRINRSSVLVFPNLKQAVRFRDEFVTCSNIQHRVWDAMPRKVSGDENHPYAVSYKTGIKFTGRKHIMGGVVPIPFELENSEMLDKLITYNISVFLFDSYLYNPCEHELTVHGNVWIPPEHIMYYPSDIATLFDKQG